MAHQIDLKSLSCPKEHTSGSNAKTVLCALFVGKRQAAQIVKSFIELRIDEARDL